ncbi:MAG: tail fiber protein [Rhodopila sp.]|nr:tail fiber protein [Rhodopila sp.]
MAEPYLGQIEAFAFGFAPRGWALCAGQIMPINQYQALFSLLGTTYGGNGTTTFALPDLRSRVAMGQGNGFNVTPRVIGQVGGEENHTLLAAETPAHVHSLMAAAKPAVSSNTNVAGPTVVLAQTIGKPASGAVFPLALYAADSNPGQPMAGTAIGSAGGQPHTNLMPYTTLNFCIALMGIYPTRN